MEMSGECFIYLTFSLSYVKSDKMKLLRIRTGDFILCYCSNINYAINMRNEPHARNVRKDSRFIIVGMVVRGRMM